MIDESGSLAKFFWGYADPSDQPPEEIPSTTETSIKLAKELKKRGFTFVGPTTVYAFMQSMGLVNDHLADCHIARRARKNGARSSLPSRTRRLASGVCVFPPGIRLRPGLKHTHAPHFPPRF